MNIGRIGASILQDIFQDVATPVKTVGRGSKKKFVRDVNTKGEERGSIVIPTEEVVAPLVERQARALDSESSVSVMPAPGKFFNRPVEIGPLNPKKSTSYKGDRMSDMLEEADIELDLDFGNYIVMGKKPQDVSDKTFQNLFITPRTSNKELSGGIDNKTLARANAYDGPDLTLKNMKDNYEKNVGKEGTVYRTNLVQPGNFSLEGNRRLNHPIVAVQSMSGPEALEAFSGKARKHYYGLDMQFVGPVRMDKITSRNKDGTVPQPNLRPATVGNITLGNEIGEVKVSGNMHVLYDYIEVDGSMSLADKIRREAKFNLGGLVQRPNK
jgi:hypothetical protein